MTRALAAALLALGLGCAGALELRGFGEEPKDDTTRVEVEQAVAQSKANPGAAAEKLEAIRARDPEGEQADDIAIALGQIHQARKDDARAASSLQAGLDAQPQGNRSDDIRLELAKLEVKRGRKETAYQVLAPVRLQNLSAGQRREAVRMLVDLARTRRDRVAEIQWLSRLRAESADLDGVALVDVEIDERLKDLSRPELEQVAEKLRGAVPAGRVRIREAELAIQLGQLDAAGNALAQASSLALTKDDAKRLSKVEAELVKRGGKLPRDSAGTKPAPPAPPPVTPGDGTPEGVNTVGVVLPLSGRYAKFGEESLNGILLAGGVFEANPIPGTAQLRILVRDSGSDPAAAGEAVAAFAADAGVAAVIGPLLAEETENAAGAAESASLPLLTLSSKEGVAGESQHVYRFGATPRSEAEALAAYAVDVQGMKRFAILYPEDNYGRGLRDLFQQAVQARGAQVVRIVGYTDEDRDLSAPVRDLLTAPKPAGATAPFDAVFVPDSRQRGVQAAQALAAQKVSGVRVLGARGWQSPDLLRLGGTAIEGAIFTEPFDPGSSSPTVTDFMRRYHQSYGRAPDVFAAQAYDATRVLLSTLPPGTTSRAELEERLRRVRGYPGAAGTITLSDDGTVRKMPAIRGVRSGRIVELQ